MGDERREAEGRDEPDEPEVADGSERRPSVSVIVVQQNPVIIGGRFWAPRDRNGGWI